MCSTVRKKGVKLAAIMCVCSALHTVWARHPSDWNKLADRRRSYTTKSRLFTPVYIKITAFWWWRSPPLILNKIRMIKLTFHRWDGLEQTPDWSRFRYTLFGKKTLMTSARGDGRKRGLESSLSFHKVKTELRFKCHFTSFMCPSDLNFDFENAIQDFWDKTF